MKIKINDVEVEGKASEVAELIREMSRPKDLSYFFEKKESLDGGDLLDVTPQNRNAGRPKKNPVGRPKGYKATSAQVKRMLKIHRVTKHLMKTKNLKFKDAYKKAFKIVDKERGEFHD